MREDLFRELERHIDALVAKLRRATSRSVLQWAANELFVLSKEGISATGLSSPAKQVLHVLGLMLVTPPESPVDLDEPGWRSIKEEIEGAYRQYARMFFPTAEEIKRSGPEWARVRKVAMSVYLDRFNTYPLLNRDQISDRVRELFPKFDSVVEQHIGLDTATLIEMTDWIWANQEERLGTLASLYADVHEEWEAWKKSGESPQQARARITAGPKADLGARFAEALEFRNIVDEDAFRQVFGVEPTERFLAAFSATRGLAARFRLLGDDNPAEERPLIRDEHQRLFCVSPQMVHLAMLSRLDSLLRSTIQAEAYLRQRDRVLASKTASLLRPFFGSSAPVLESVYRGSEGRDENDILAVLGDECLAVEAKAKRTRVPARDPDMAFAQIEQDFRHTAGIQGGYEQALALRNYLLKPGAKHLYNKGGTVVLSVGAPPRNVLPIIVTWDSWGALATDLTLMLQKGPGDPYPWVVSVDQLELVLEAFRHEGEGVDEFLRFLRARQQVHGHVETADELEVVGAFLENDGFPPEWTAPDTVIVATADLARIFDRIQAEKRGVTTPMPPPLKLWDVTTPLREAIRSATGRAKSQSGDGGCS